MPNLPRTAPSKSFSRAAIAAFSLSFLLPAFAFATVVVFEDLPTMAGKSDVIAHVVVRDQQVKEEANGRIVTFTTLEVLEGFKGAKSGDVLNLFQVGGEMKGKRQWITGAHRYTFAEQMVLFGVRYKDRVLSYGVGLGKFKIVGEGEKAVVREDITDVVAARPGPTGKMEMHAPTARTFTSLAAFRAEVQEALKPKAHQRAPKQLRRIKPLDPKTLKIKNTGTRKEGR
jgi:hypothetical protein